MVSAFHALALSLFLTLTVGAFLLLDAALPWPAAALLCAPLGLPATLVPYLVAAWVWDVGARKAADPSARRAGGGDRTRVTSLEG